MKDTPLCREKASFEGLYVVTSPNLHSLSLWFAMFENSSVCGDEVHCIMIRWGFGSTHISIVHITITFIKDSVISCLTFDVLLETWEWQSQFAVIEVP